METQQRRRHFSLIRIAALCFAVVLVIGLAPLSRAQDYSEPYFFPETGHSIKGAFRYFWETNGGVANFGYPITEEYVPAYQAPLTQYFEKARFELVEQNGQYHVRLGPLGAEILAGRSFPKAQPIPNTAQRRYIPETGYIIQYGFKEVWETRGGARIFGWPLSNELEEQTADGQVRIVQYFENARFEFWPQFAPGQRVLLSNLGVMLAPPEQTSPAVPGGEEPQQQPQEQQSSLPPNQNGVVVPEAGPPGTMFFFQAGGFEGEEDIVLWYTRPDGSTEPIDRDDVKSDSEGSINHENITIDSSGFGDGVWAITAQGDDSGEEGKAYAFFRIDSTLPPPPTPEPPPATRATGRCSDNAPEPTEGLVAWMTEDEPELDETVRVCVQYIVDGKAIAGARVEGTIRYDEDDDDIGPEETNANGVAEIKFEVTDDDDEADSRVWIDIYLEHAGRRYQTKTSFIPRD
jgi:hypothetical protein